MYKNTKAFSLIELMITVTVAGIFSLVSVKMFDIHTKTTRTIEAKYELIAVTEIIKEALGNASSCTKTLGGRNAEETAYTGNLTTVPPNGINTIYKNIRNSLNFATLYVSNPNPSSATTYNRLIKFIGFGLEEGASNTVEASSIGYTNFKMRIQVAGASFGSKFIERKIKIRVQTDSDTRIVTCGDFSSLNKKEMARLFCLSIGGIFNGNGRDYRGSCQNLEPYGHFTITNEGYPSVTARRQSDTVTDQLLKYMCETFRGTWVPFPSRCANLKIKGTVTINSSTAPREGGNIQIINNQGADFAE